MEQVRKLESKLGDISKDLPPLSKNTKESLASVWPWIALILGVLQLFAAWSLWELYHRAQPLIDLANQYSQYYTGRGIGYSSFDKGMMYLAIAILVVDALLLIMAFSPLKSRLKRGWDLMFLSALVSIVYSVVLIFVDGRGLGSFIFSMLFTAIGLYFLFQLRDLYKGKDAPSKPVKSE